jgi:hypothetical protein
VAQEFGAGHASSDTSRPVARLTKSRAPARDLARTAVDVLNAIRDVGGIESFDTSAKHLLLSVAATVSHSESPERLYHLLDLIETCNSPELVRQRHDEFKD